MTDEDSAQTATKGPLPSFHFHVAIGAADALNGSFSEVTGLGSENSAIEYRHGDSKLFSVVNIPGGMTKVGNVTLKRGVFKSDNAFWSWSGSIQQNTVKRQNVVITLLDEKGEVAISWTLTNAFPTKITGAELRADASEVAVTTIEMAFETLAIISP